MTPAFAQLMPTSLDALSNLDWFLISLVGLLLLVCGGLALRLQQTDAISDGDAEDSATEGSSEAPSEQGESLQKAQAELKEAREEAELTLLQLHQVQEELEHYFLLSREQSSLLDAHAEQQKRVQKLLKVALQTRSASELSGVS